MQIKEALRHFHALYDHSHRDWPAPLLAGDHEACLNHCFDIFLRWDCQTAAHAGEASSYGSGLTA